MGSVAYIGLGSNVGDRGLTLMEALKALDDAEGVEVRRVSRFTITEPVGGPEDQPPYLNGAAEVVTDLTPDELLATLQGIERRLGRNRDAEQRWGPRTCDLDLLLFADRRLDDPALTVPHPRMHEREFVLEPLVQIAPQLTHPVLGKTMVELLDDLRAAPAPPQPIPAGPGEGAEARLISVIGLPASGKTTLAELLAADLPAELIREDYEGNPFLADSYTGPQTARLPAQLWYLLSRVRQLSRRGWPDEGLFVSDYGFCQDRLYALERLSADEITAYEAVHAHVAGLVRPPDVVIFLDVSVETVLERIARRGREFEQAMTRGFLASMCEGYARLTHRMSEEQAELVTVDAGTTDVRRPADRARLIERIRSLI